MLSHQLHILIVGEVADVSITIARAGLEYTDAFLDLVVDEPPCLEQRPVLHFQKLLHGTTLESWMLAFSVLLQPCEINLIQSESMDVERIANDFVSKMCATWDLKKHTHTQHSAHILGWGLVLGWVLECSGCSCCCTLGCRTIFPAFLVCGPVSTRVIGSVMSGLASVPVVTLAVVLAWSALAHRHVVSVPACWVNAVLGGLAGLDSAGYCCVLFC